MKQPNCRTQILLLLAIIFPSFLYSQAFCGFTCSDCLNSTFLSKSKIITVSNMSYASSNISNAFIDFQITKPSCVVNTGCLYGSDAAENSLTYDVYYPYLSCGTYPQLPAIILFHGGGFSECSDKSDEEDYCIDFARRGFVAFSVEYRRGKDGDNSGISASYMLALYRGLQDARGAIRTIIKRQNDGGEPYKIDVNKIFIGGQSEGGVIAVNTAYLDQQEADAVMPGVSAVLGTLDDRAPMPRFYYGKPAMSYTIRGVINLWGGLAESDSSGTALNFIDAGEPPFIGFHGELDATVAYNLYANTYSTGSKATADQCDSIHYTNPAAGNIVWLAGSSAIYDECLSKNICAEVYLDSDMGHGTGGDADPFGLSYNQNSKVRAYIVQRAASFFQAVLCDECSNINTSLFFDCVNSRCKAASSPDMSDNYSCSGQKQMIVTSNEQYWKVINSGTYLEVIFFDPSNATIELFNQNGQLLRSTSGFFHHLDVDISSLWPGSYLLRISTAMQTQSEHVVLFGRE
ncbi:MAG TPA: alpha/beta hydrolase fold domain-containing protein [Chitinophagales bacterium]|nr:alpha/beta hydrolase fold domain-containing protein [Chitinophagales bacterium]